MLIGLKAKTIQYMEPPTTCEQLKSFMGEFPTRASEFSLPNIDLLIDANARHSLFSFIDGFKG